MSSIMNFENHKEMAKSIIDLSIDFLDCCFTDATGRMGHIMVSSSNVFQLLI